jgi:phenylpropionate dioxygenase-like ring-hydroxylating dioxygenase large terminal subunit
MSKLDSAAADPSAIRRSPAVSYQTLLDQDTRPVPDHLRVDTAAFLGDQDIPVDRYIDPKFHQLEKQKLWNKVWQVALREERIPNVGDADVYEINDISIILMRVAPDTIKGYFNACLHMGRTLIERPCNLREIRCPYHGFTWHTDGKLKRIHGMWDFPHVDVKKFNLPEVRVGTWGGFIFINMDPNCEPLDSYLGELNKHFEKYCFSDRYTAVHVVKVLRANWKTAQEAFMDAYHVVATHPQVLASTGDDNTQYDVFGNCSRAITPYAVPSPHLNWRPTEDEIAASVYRPIESTPVTYPPPGTTYREFGAQRTRDALRNLIGEKADELSDTEALDAFYYTVFPNLHPFMSYGQTVQLFKPYNDRHDMCTMEILHLRPFAGERPPPAKPHFVSADENFLTAPELGVSAALLCQDEWNIEKAQRGMHTLQMTKPGLTLGIYQHTQVRHFHNLYERYMKD